jgi:hypothetical protein
VSRSLPFGRLRIILRSLESVLTLASMPRFVAKPGRMPMSSWHVRATEDGNVEMDLGGQVVKITAKDAGLLATTLLDCARAGGDPSTAPKAHGPIGWLPARPTTITLGSSPDPGQEALVLGSGPALVGASLSKQSLKTIGAAMIALSADGRKT